MMTPAEIRDAVVAMNKEFGWREGLYISVSSDGCDGAAYAALYPGSILDGVAFRIRGDDWAILFDDVRAKWAEHSSIHRTRRIREMALAIIRITAEQDTCTDAALRGDGRFTDAEVSALGSEACADADAIAANGPFSIFTIAKANAA